MPNYEITEYKKQIPAKQQKRENVKRFKEKSLQGSSGKRTGKTIKMSRKSFIARLKILFAMGLIAGTILGYHVPGAIQKFEDDALVGKLIKEYQVDVIEPNTYRTDDNSGHFYDTMSIAKEIYEAGEENYAEYIYYTLCNTGENNTGIVIEQLYRVYIKTGECKTLEDYYHRNGYENTDDFKKSVKERILAKTESNELQEILEETNQATQENSGKTK